MSNGVTMHRSYTLLVNSSAVSVIPSAAYTNSIVLSLLGVYPLLISGACPSGWLHENKNDWVLY